MSPRVVNQNATHHFRGYGKEVRAILPLHSFIDQPQIRFVNQSRRLQRVAWTLATHVAMSEPVQLIMYQRDELIVSRLVAVAPINKQRGYFIGYRRGIHFKSLRNPSVNSSTSSVAFGPTKARNPILTFSLRVGRDSTISRLVG